MNTQTELTAAEKNEHYGKLNARFDEREQFLRSAGFKRETVSALNIAIYTRSRFGRSLVITAAAVLMADEIVWGDKVEEVNRFNA